MCVLYVRARYVRVCLRASVYRCVFAFMRACMRLIVRVSLLLYACMCLSLCACVYVCVCVRVCVCVCLCECVCAYACDCVCMCVRACVLFFIIHKDGFARTA